MEREGGEEREKRERWGEREGDRGNVESFTVIHIKIVFNIT